MAMFKLLIDDPIFLSLKPCSVHQRRRYECPECKYLLRDAVQISCGHCLCSDCAKKIYNTSSTCPECNENLEVNKTFPDLCLQREINSFNVKCCHNRCSWMGILKDYSKHMNECYYTTVKVEGESYHKTGQTKVTLMKCPYVKYGCEATKEMSEEELQEHKMNSCRFQAHQCQLQDQTVSSVRSNTMMEDVAKNDGDLVPILNPHIDLNSVLEGQPSSDDKSRLTKLLQVNSEFVVSSRLRPPLIDDEISTNVWAPQLSQIDDAQWPSENELRLSILENSTYDGKFIWKIPEFSRRRDDATTGKYTSIFSPPFYSGRYGYKMCLRLYILGDGIGKGSHMSLFFVLMKGEFDNILQWPFNHKVTFKLINQCGGRDVVDVFQPDPLSSSFQKPKTDMNIASGCPRFISLNELVQNGFIMDDTIFIKVKVDTLNIMDRWIGLIL